MDAGITTFYCTDIYVGVEEMIGTFISGIRRSGATFAAWTIIIHLCRLRY